MKKEKNKWQHFTDTEIEILYSALADYRKQKKRDIPNSEEYDPLGDYLTANSLISDLLKDRGNQ